MTPPKTTESRDINKSSRATITNNETSNLTVYPRRSESLTKSSMVIQPRYTQTTIDPYTSHFLVK
jgi:hypothetical protein